MTVFIGVYRDHVIAARFNNEIPVAIPATLLCINRRLYLLASQTSVIPSKEDKNRALIIDLVIGFGLPLVVMALCLSSNLKLPFTSSAYSYSAFIVQKSRFIIIEDYGCDFFAPATWVTLVISIILPIILELISGVYGCLSIRAYYNRSKLNETHNTLNPDRYTRLMCFSAADLFVGTPIAVYYLYSNAVELIPFSGVTQNQFSVIYQLPAVEWRADTKTELGFELNRWLIIYSAFVFFSVFGFTQESRNNYRAVLQFVVKVFVKITGIKCRPRNQAEGCVTSFFSSILCLIYIDTLICYLESYSITPR